MLMAGLAAKTERIERSAVVMVMTWRAAGAGGSAGSGSSGVAQRGAAGDAARAGDRASMWAELLAAQCRKRAQLCAFDPFKAPGMVPPGSVGVPVCPCCPLQAGWLCYYPRMGCPAACAHASVWACAGCQ